MATVSIIIPVYNVDRYLARCLDSVLSQTFQDIEIICVNDGCTDNSAQILTDYERKDKRIKIITQKNQGLSEARNTGLKHATGEYIYFIDSDDAIEPQTIEICYKTALAYQAELVSFYLKKSDGITLPSLMLNTENIQAEIYNQPLYCGCSGKKRIPFSVCTKFYKASLLKNLEFIKGIQFEDYPFTYAVLLKHPKTAVIPLNLYLYTTNLASISHQKSTVKQIADYWKGISYIISLYSQKGYEKELKFFTRNGLPRLLKHQYVKCKRASDEDSSEMWRIFTNELYDLEQKKLLSPIGHNLWRYYQYKKLIKNKTC